MSLAGADVGVVYAIDDDGPYVLASEGFNALIDDAAQRAWEEFQAQLADGQAVEVSGFRVWPIFHEAGVAGLLHLDRRNEVLCTDADFESALSNLGRLIRRLTDSGASAPELGAAAATEREKLLSLLHRNEWNIARVARLCGVTRRTIYLRLERWRIPRQHIPKKA